MPTLNMLYRVLASAIFLGSFGCSASDRPQQIDRHLPEVSGGQVGERCRTPQEGCACADPGAILDCGQVRERHGDYVTCSVGTRTCKADGVWSACIGQRTTLKPNSLSAPGKRALQLGSAAACASGFDPCDPYCNMTEDVPVGLLDLPDGLVETVEGLTLTGTGAPSCTDLELTASTPRLDVSQFAPLTISPAGPVTFTLTGFPAGCSGADFPASWVVDKPDRAFVTGDSSTNGALTLVDPLGGMLRVTAYALGFNKSVQIEVKVNVLVDRNNVSPNTVSSSTTRYNEFGPWNAPVAGSTAATVTWLYPYADTFFPLGLPPPAVMYWYTSSTGNGTSTSLQDRNVKVSLRYPANTSSHPSAGAGYSDFNYSIIVRESNALTTGVGLALDSRDPQVVIPAAAWQYFERTARGNYADIVIQRNRAGTVEQESRRRIFFVNGQLKGRVVYNSYNSPLADGGAILAIEPGATAPEVAAQPNGECTVCHSVNKDGNFLIANGYRNPGNSWYNQSQRFDISDNTTFPNPPVLQSYTYTSTEGNYTGNPFTWGGPWGDGLLYMTHGGCSPGATNGSCASSDGDPNWRAPRRFSNLYSVVALGDAERGGVNPPPIAVANWPGNMLAITPRFSPDGTRLAFGFWGGSSISGVGPDAVGRKLAVVNFTCSSPPCTSSSTGWSVSNAKDVTPSIGLRVGWPTFAPDGNSVAYQAMYRTARSKGLDPSGVAAGMLDGALSARDGGGSINWSASHINTIAGALSEIWLSNIPTSGAATPTRLRSLNGLNPTGTGSYLPEDIRAMGAFPTAYHRNAGASFLIRAADRCEINGTASNTKDYQLNYLPSMAPTEAGNKAWVVFTSRRMFGNFAVDTPWDGKLGHSCYTGKPSTKKLWIAAIDMPWTPGTDPSHPAFFMPGQELLAGNNDGYWADTPCSTLGNSCVTNDDCCGGTGSAPTTQCRIVSAPTAMTSAVRQCADRNSCSAVGEECAVMADCCTGLLCPDGGGLCVQEPNEVFQRETLEREYVAECPEGTSVEWRFFEWQATVPDGTSLEFLVQTKQSSGDIYEPEEPLLMYETTTTTPVDTWHRGSTTVHDLLSGDPPALTSRQHLLVTVAFNPDTAGSVAPTLQRWRQVFDCVPSQ